MKFDHTFSDFLNEIGRYPLLTMEQELVLGRQVQSMVALKEKEAQGGKLTKKELRAVRVGMRAKEQMVNCNLRMVVSIAKKYLKRVHHLTMLDLVQEGVIGLMRGVEKFDPQRGYKFSTYAYWWIRQGMNRACNQQDSAIRMPHHVAEKVPKLKQAIHRLSQELGRMPTKKELADAMEMSVDQMWMIFERTASPCSLDAQLQEEGSALIDVLPDTSTEDNDAIFLMDDRWRLEAGLARLPDRARYVVEQRHELTGKAPVAYQVLAQELGLSRERVRQIEIRALRQLRTYMKSVSPLADPKALANFTSHGDKIKGLVSLRLSAKEQDKLQLANAANGVG
jgi:RNA polymerase sigma factor (sigma-70 family)